MKFTALPNTRFLLAYLVAIIIFYFSLGLNVINPTNVNWIMSYKSDLTLQYLGWEYFRYDPWAFPLGKMESYTYPLGTNMAYTDSLPLLGLFFKLFSGILPAEFQYFGIWLLFCYLMIAHYTLKILELYKIRILHALPIIALVVANPCLWFRYIHPALSAHGFILAGIYLYLRPADPDNVKKINRTQVVLTIITSLIHPYLWAIVIGFNFIIPLKNWLYDKALTLKQATIYIVITFLGTFFLWCMVGLIDFKGDQSLAAGDPFYWPLNLNVLYNPWGASAFLPELSRGFEGNYEGYMYLGVGIFCIIAAALAGLALNRGFTKKLFSQKWLLPLIILVFLLTVFAISNKAMIGDTVVYDIKLPDWILFFGKVFRASARFFWVAYYLIILFFCIILVRSGFKPRLVLALLLIFTAIQAYDLKHFRRSLSSGTYDTPYDDKNWESIMANYDAVITYTPLMMHNNAEHDWMDLMYLALKVHKPITLGSTARDKVDKVAHYRDSLTSAIMTDYLPKGELYVTTPKNLEYFSAQLYNKRLKADYLDGFYLLYAPDTKFKINNPTTEAVKKRDSVIQRYAQKSEFTTVATASDKKIRYNMETFSVVDNVIMTGGWAFVDKRENHTGDSLFITITKNGTVRATPAQVRERPDMISENKTLINCGFFAVVNSNEEILPTDKIGLAIKTSDGEWVLAETDKHKIANDHANPVKINAIPLSNPAQAGNIDEFVTDASEIKMTGWSIFKDMDNSHTQIKVVLTGNSGSFICPTAIAQRPDLIAGDDDKYHYINCGFSVKIRTALLPAGKYKVGTMVINTKTGGQSVLISDKVYTKR